MLLASACPHAAMTCCNADVCTQVQSTWKASSMLALPTHTCTLGITDICQSVLCVGTQAACESRAVCVQVHSRWLCCKAALLQVRVRCSPLLKARDTCSWTVSACCRQAISPSITQFVTLHCYTVTLLHFYTFTLSHCYTVTLLPPQLRSHRPHPCAAARPAAPSPMRRGQP